MTDYLYTSPVADLGYGRRQETINKEVCAYPAPNRYEPRKNDKIVDPQVRTRQKPIVKEAKGRQRAARRKKDRPEDDPRAANAPAIIHPGYDQSPGKADTKVDVQAVYTLGMDERDKRRISDIPGPGTHNIKSKLGEGPAFNMGGSEKDTKIDRDQAGPNSFNIVLKSRAPKYSFGGRSGVTLGIGNKFGGKSMKPGPGAYDLADTQFRKPTTKFSQAAKNSLMKPHGPPASKAFDPKPVELEADKYSFPLAKRLDDPLRERNARFPGPGEYEVLNQLPKGQHKSMLGGSTAPEKIKDNGVPGPGNYFAEGDASEYLNHIPGVKIKDQPPRFKELKQEDDENAKKYQEKKPKKEMHKTPAGYSIGKGVREPLKNKFTTPAPNHYYRDEDKDDKNKDKKYHFHMGMRTNYKANRGQDMPGPAEYYPDIYQPTTIAHTMTNGQRSDLGVGKAYLSPGPGAYDIRGKIEGPQIKFGNEVKQTKIKKTYEPGPANYDLPGTVGNIPKYLRLKQENEELGRIDDKSDNIELL